MIGSRIAAALAVLLALAGWGLYHQISVSGGLQELIEQSERELSEANGTIDTLNADIKARDEASKLLEAERDDLRKRSAKVRTVVRTVYAQPDVKPWAETVPPAAVVDSVGAGIDSLWGTAGADNAHGGAVTPGGDDGGLPAP